MRRRRPGLPLLPPLPPRARPPLPLLGEVERKRDDFFLSSLRPPNQKNKSYNESRARQATNLAA